MKTIENVCRRSTHVYSAMKFSIRRLYARASREAGKQLVRGERESRKGGRKRARDVKDFWCRTRAIWPRLGGDGSAVVRSRGRKEEDRFASQIEILKFKSCRDLSLKSPRPPAGGDGCERGEADVGIRVLARSC